MNTRIAIIPQYLKDFQCIGSKCEDNCCYGWRVFIDKNTYKKYTKTSKTSFKHLFTQNIVRNRINPSSEFYAEIKMNENTFCPFLGDDKLCSIQRKLGGGFLSKVCVIYPRVTKLIDGVYEKSLTLSCPEAARLVLLNSNIMEFEEIEEKVEVRGLLLYKLDTNSVQNANSIVEYFWPLRIFSISLIQNH